MERTYRIYIVRYYNVFFYLVAKSEQDIYKIELFGERIEKGELVKMRDIQYWCVRQNIEYRSKFKYKKEYPISANLWNYYTYCRFRLEGRLNKNC